MPRSLREENRRSWNVATRAHNSHKEGQAEFLAAGGSTLFPEEIALLGPLQGARVLHLLCNSGQDTLSLTHLGATVTGVDISDEAIDTARRLSTEANLPATFHRADVYDWLDDPSGGPFDAVFLSYGALYWLEDLARLFRGAAALLVPGGRVVVQEFHPTAYLFDADWLPTWPYSTGGRPLTDDEGIGDYVALSAGGLVPFEAPPGAEGFQNPHRCHGYAWSVSEMVNALLGAGLRLDAMREQPYFNGCPLLADMRRDDQRRFWPPARFPNLPMMLGLRALKP